MKCDVIDIKCDVLHMKCDVIDIKCVKEYYLNNINKSVYLARMDENSTGQIYSCLPSNYIPCFLV